MTKPETLIESEKRDHQVFDDRAKAAVQFLFKTILGISLATIALFFSTLTRTVEPPITANEKVVLLTSVLLMTLAIIGVFLYAYSWYILNISKAQALRQRTDESISYFGIRQQQFHRLRKVGTTATIIGFVAGLTSSVVFMVMRIFGI